MSTFRSFGAPLGAPDPAIMQPIRPGLRLIAMFHHHFFAQTAQHNDLTMTSFNQDHQDAAAPASGSSTTDRAANVANNAVQIDADRTTTIRGQGTGRIRSSSTSKDGISWECGNLLHFEDINNEVEDDDSSVSSDDSSVDGDSGKDNNAKKRSTTTTSRRRTRAVNNDLANAFSSGLTMRRTSSVESFQQKIIEKHTSSGSLSRVSSLHASNGSGGRGSSLRSYLSFSSSGFDAAGGVAPRTATGTSSAGAGSNANFEHQRGNNGIGSSSQSRRNASATSAGRALLDRRN